MAACKNSIHLLQEETCFYNQSNIKGKVVPVDPTPTIGMLGLVEDKSNLMTEFQA